MAPRTENPHQIYTTGSGKKAAWVGSEPDKSNQWIHLYACTDHTVERNFAGIPGRTITLQGPGYFWVFDSAKPTFFDDLKKAIDQTIQHVGELKSGLTTPDDNDSPAAPDSE